MKVKKIYKMHLHNSHSKKYNLVWINEYKIMRQEIVNYMEKLQALRNMMYITIGAVLTFSISIELPFFCVLLPLLFILPAYMTAVNYWICVRKVSAYLVVFHESYEDCPIHWESRHNMLKKLNNTKENFKKNVYKNIPSQLISYYSCTAITMIVYILQFYKIVTDKMLLRIPADFWNICIDGIPVLTYMLVGVIITIFLLVFLLFPLREKVTTVF